jgi:preprotein translocase subunit SecB
MNNAQYNIDSIFTVESQFKREQHIDFSHELKTNINISNKILSPENDDPAILAIEVYAEVFGIINDIKVFAASTTVLGIFKETDKEGKLSRDVFSKVNAPAILYPYVRENISTLCLKGGVGHIFLPPVNFIKKAEDELVK